MVGFWFSAIIPFLLKHKVSQVNEIPYYLSFNSKTELVAVTANFDFVPVLDMKRLDIDFLCLTLELK